MRTFLAKECGKALATSSSDLALQNLQRVMKEKFAESVFLAGVPEKLGGAICLQVTSSKFCPNLLLTCIRFQYNKDQHRGEFLWTHTTASMGIGFQSTSEEEATVKMSRLPVTPQQVNKDLDYLICDNPEHSTGYYNFGGGCTISNPLCLREINSRVSGDEVIS